MRESFSLEVEKKSSNTIERRVTAASRANQLLAEPFFDLCQV